MKAMLDAPGRAAAGRGRARSASRAYVDTGPIVERAYAAAAGIGAWGKNTCLLHPEHGSWFFLGEIVTDLDLAARRAAHRHVRKLHRLPRRLPHRRLARALRPRRHALHQLPDHRGEGRHPGGAPRGRGPPRLRLRHLPGRVPVEPEAARARRRRLRAAARACWRPTSRASRVSTRRPSASASGESPVKRAQAARAAAQRGGGPRQLGRRREAPGARAAGRGRRPRRARARPLGAAAARPAPQFSFRLFLSSIL